jgi:hypothetical protein
VSDAIDPYALSQAAESMRPALREYAALVQQSAGSGLSGLTVYGEVLDAGFEPSRGAMASALVLERMDLNLLRHLAEQGPKLGRKHIAAPFITTPDYIKGSLDTFPLEFLEISQRHATLCGRDHFETLEFSPQYVRLQCEREFKRVLIRLRQGLLAAAGREAVLGHLRWDIGLHLLRTLAGLLWLKGLTKHLPREQILAESEKLLGSPLAGVRAAVLHHGEPDWVEFTALYNEVEKLAKVADGL